MSKRKFFLVWLVVIVAAGLGVQFISSASQPARQRSSEEVLSVHDNSVKPLTSTGKQSYSGDDPYDPAANSALANGAGETIQVSPAASKFDHDLRSGGYSGDDPYDPAAGGLSR